MRGAAVSAGIGWIPSVAILARLDRLREEHSSYVLSTVWQGRERGARYIAQGTLDTHPYAVVARSLAEVETALAGPGG